MSSELVNSSPTGRAEQAFREAFARLKSRRPDLLPKGTLVSQNNVAKEAGCVPSALRKSRFPSLVGEIQRWVKEHADDGPISTRQTVLAQRSRNRSLKERIEEVTAERDHALSLLVEADAKILELMLENASLQALRAQSNVSSLHDQQSKR
jgi:hypothetical protein